MDEKKFLTEQFEARRRHLRGVAYRMLGSLSEAEDAVQEAWLRLARTDVSGVGNLGGWLTTVVARVCLDMLRSRKSRREDGFGTELPPQVAERPDVRDIEMETQLADQVGIALLVVLETLEPAERLAFVLHDMFDLPFDDIAPIVGRSPVAARQLASRARRRVQGKPATPETDRARQREVVDAFLAASRGGDFNALLAVLDPDVTLRADPQAIPAGVPLEERGAEIVARRAQAGRSPFAEPALVDGNVGIVVAPHGRLRLVLALTIVGKRIAAIDVIADPRRLEALDIAVLE